MKATRRVFVVLAVVMAFAVCKNMAFAQQAATKTIAFPGFVIGGNYAMVVRIVNNTDEVVQVKTYWTAAEGPGTPQDNAMVADIYVGKQLIDTGSGQMTPTLNKRDAIVFVAKNPDMKLHTGTMRVKVPLTPAGNMAATVSMSFQQFDESNEVIAAASVLASDPVSAASLCVNYAEATGDLTGFAISNPSSSPITVRIQLLDSVALGRPLDVTVPAYGETAMYAHQVAGVALGDFVGSLDFTVLDGGLMAIVGLQFSGKTMTTLPIGPGRAVQ